MQRLDHPSNATVNVFEHLEVPQAERSPSHLRQRSVGLPIPPAIPCNLLAPVVRGAGADVVRMTMPVGAVHIYG